MYVVAFFHEIEKFNLLCIVEKIPILLMRMADGQSDFRPHAANSIVSIDACPYSTNTFLTGYADGTLKVGDSFISIISVNVLFADMGHQGARNGYFFQEIAKLRNRQYSMGLGR